jgi:tetratricopeptide (TPR) repeat protein
MTHIAQKLYGPRYYTDFQPLAPAAQQAMLSQDLRSKTHLLILDNLESITGAHLAIQHTLPPAEQAALRSFLTDLAKGHTLVLLGSRGGEDWLARGTFDDNIYELPGLDPEAASTLADRILERNNVTKYRQEEDLRKLINVLDGFPLALEVVLANLTHQTPGEVLAALQAGDVKLDIAESKQQDKSIFEQKTESILRCIDYSHSNLSPEAQQLLLCLAPFTSVIWQNMLDEYTTHLREQPALAGLPFERWSEIIQEAINWGLLSPDTNSPGFLRLQPILPYFLRNRLGMPGQAEIRNAVETAFRQHYDQLGAGLYNLLDSKDPQERQMGQLLTSLEYENLVTALNLALEAQLSILNYYIPLSEYLDITQDQRRGLELGQTVLSRIESYPPDKLGADPMFVIHDIATRQLELKQYVDAEASYHKALSVWLGNTSYDADIIKQQCGPIYQQLGKVALEQRQWAKAERYYQQALQIFIEYNDQRSQALTYHHLGSVALEQRQWAEAEQHYQQALKVYDDVNERYLQAATYHQLGTVAQEQRQWTQAREYFLRALKTYVDYNDTHNGSIVLRSLARLWQSSGDKDLPAAIAKILDATLEETKALLHEMLDNQPGEPG